LTLSLALVLSPVFSSAHADDARVSTSTLDLDRATLLIRSTLTTINDANLTSNYSVLRDAGAPEFQEKFSEDRLAATFKTLRQNKVDIAAAVLLEPVIVKAEVFEAQAVVQFRGYVPTTPAHVRFKLGYKYVDRRWKLYGLDIVLAPKRDNDHTF
jgi:hypothetical protein